MVSEPLDPLDYPLFGQLIIVESTFQLVQFWTRGCVKKSHIEYEMTLANIYKQVVSPHLTNRFCEDELTHIYF
jgi:hypothetical protein